jgi:hypothetical protein
MPTAYEERDGQSFGSLVCDECGAAFTDERPETPGSSILMRGGELGWGLYRPNPYRANIACPACLPAARLRCG